MMHCQFRIADRALAMMTKVGLLNAIRSVPYTGLFLATMITAGSAAIASAVTVDAIDSGFVTEMGGSSKGDGTVPAAASATFNYSVGRELHYSGGFLSPPPFAPMLRNNYFVFDLTGVIPGTITSAALKVFAGTYEGTGPLDSDEFALVAPMDPVMALGEAGFLLAANAVGTTAFDDPGDPAIAVAMGLYGNITGGPGPLGVKTISSADDGTILTIPLGPGGVGYLNAFAGGVVILGGKVTTAPPPDFPQQPFGFVGPFIGPTPTPTPMLDITIVPEPTTILLVIVGLTLSPQRRDC
jgi:hypothetical protein